MDCVLVVYQAQVTNLPPNCCFLYLNDETKYSCTLLNSHHSSKVERDLSPCVVAIRVADWGWKTTSVGQITHQNVGSNLTPCGNLSLEPLMVDLVTLLQWCRSALQGVSVHCDITVWQMKRWFLFWLWSYSLRRKPNTWMKTYCVSFALWCCDGSAAFA